MNDADAPGMKLPHAEVAPISIIFVYDADAGLLNVLVDALHKALSPRTYRCHLCRLTHGTFGMHRAWRAFVDELTYPTLFYHRDEFLRDFGSRLERPPAVFVGMGDELTCLLSSEDIGSCRTSIELMERLRLRLSTHLRDSSDD